MATSVPHSAESGAADWFGGDSEATPIYEQLLQEIAGTPPPDIPEDPDALADPVRTVGRSIDPEPEQNASAAVLPTDPRHTS